MVVAFATFIAEPNEYHGYLGRENSQDWRDSDSPGNFPIISSDNILVRTGKVTGKNTFVLHYN